MIPRNSYNQTTNTPLTIPINPTKLLLKDGFLRENSIFECGGNVSLTGFSSNFTYYEPNMVNVFLMVYILKSVKLLQIPFNIGTIDLHDVRKNHVNIIINNKWVEIPKDVKAFYIISHDYSTGLEYNYSNPDSLESDGKQIQYFLNVIPNECEQETNKNLSRYTVIPQNISKKNVNTRTPSIPIENKDKSLTGKIKCHVINIITLGIGYFIQNC
ncbi:hypothetical protein [Dasineura jujubifolia toursvirus 2a]|nr:hypothetical protein [Dasineura jujubifolia toursvirus 2a]